MHILTMALQGGRRDWGWVVGLSLGMLLGGGCFVGDAASGLPCNAAEDCGLGEACSLDSDKGVKCCGGVCSDAVVVSTSSGSSTTDPTTSGSESLTLSTTDVTIEPSSTTEVDTCGDGVLDPGEECDNSENPNCNVDTCQYDSDCGNGVRDPGEACDVWGHPEPELCSNDCLTRTLIAWDEDSTDAEAARDFCPNQGDCERWTGEKLPGGAPRTSGAYFTMGSPLPADGGWPDATLRTRAFTIPELHEGDRVVVRVDHLYAIDADTDGNVGRPSITRSDHGVVALSPAGDDSNGPPTWIRVIPRGPEGDDSYPIDCDQPAEDCFEGAVPREPFCDNEPTEFGISGERGGPGPQNTTVVFEGDALGSLSAQEFALVFRLRYDCINFPPDAEFGWELHGLSVVVETPAT